MVLIKCLHTHVAHGGNTATGVAPGGVRSKESDKVGMLVSDGEPPPPGNPGCGELIAACPLCWKFRSGSIMNIPSIDTPSAVATGTAISSKNISIGDLVG